MLPYPPPPAHPATAENGLAVKRGLAHIYLFVIIGGIRGEGKKLRATKLSPAEYDHLL